MFVVSTGSLTTYMLLSSKTHKTNKTVVILVEFTLPLLNSALYPTLIVLRKQSLREQYTGRIRGAWKWITTCCYRRPDDNYNQFTNQ